MKQNNDPALNMNIFLLSEEAAAEEGLIFWNSWILIMNDPEKAFCSCCCRMLRDYSSFWSSWITHYQYNLSMSVIIIIAWEGCFTGPDQSKSVATALDRYSH